MTSTTVTQLLDETDTTQRWRQNVAVVAGLLLFFAGLWFLTLWLGRRSPVSLALGAAALLTAAILFRFAARTLQRWEVPYKGHRVRFENSPIFAEKLFIDDALVARGGLGRQLWLEGVIPTGAGAGDRIVAHAQAGFTSFRCRIKAESASERPR